MKKALIPAACFLLFAALLATAASAADTITIQGGVRVGTFDGGEFDVTVNSTDGALLVADPSAPRYNERLYRYTAVTPKHPTSTTFTTFCVQTTQYIQIGPPGTYDASLWKSTNHLDNWAMTGDVAWLFHAWNTRGLTDYAYGVGDANRPTDAMEMQKALWALRYNTVGGLSGKALAWATTARSSTWYDPTRTTPGYTGDVYVLRLTNGPFSVATENQDQLAEFMPVPEPGSIALLACGALGALPLLRRRRTV